MQLIPKKQVYLILGYICVALGVLWFFLSGITAKQNKDYEQLNKALKVQGLKLNKDTITNMRKIEDKALLDSAGILEVFDSRQERLIKKGYDASIFFVEELKNITRSLNEKASAKQVQVSALGFKEELPSEADAVYLLKQLYCLQKVILSGIDAGVNFTEISPGALPKKSENEQFILLNSKISFTCQPKDWVEFLSGISSIRPLMLVSSMSATKTESGLSGNIVLEQLVIDDKLRYSGDVKPFNLDSYYQIEGNYLAALRAANLFFVPPAKEPSNVTEEKPIESVPVKPRFYYRGKVISRGAPQAVIEDTLNQETLFLGKGAKIAGYIMENITDEEAMLRNTVDGQELILKMSREEEQGENKEESPAAK